MRWRHRGNFCLFLNSKQAPKRQSTVKTSFLLLGVLLLLEKTLHGPYSFLHPRFFGRVDVTLKMKLSFHFVLVAVFAFDSARCFQQTTKTRRGGVVRKPTVLFAKDDREDLLPETAFGAEIVPEGQRPVNEYLDMRRAPLFEWASNDKGYKGVSDDERPIYSASFSLLTTLFLSPILSY
jgi:hypothetical protein